MLKIKVLIFELITVDGLAARALYCNQAAISKLVHTTHPEASSSITTSTGQMIHPT